MRSLSALQKTGFTFGLAGVGGCVFGALVHASQFYPGYLQAYGFWLMLSLGCLGLLQLHDLTGGRWGRELRPMLEAGVRQFTAWGDTDEGRHILIAVVRYLAAHSPTERAALQTADIARRLMRGGELHQEAGAS